MCGKKTAWYTTIQPLAIGAIVGSGEPAVEREIFEFGWYLGVLFQLVNDLDGVQPGVEKSDIEEGKRTIFVIHLLSALPPADRSRFIQIMRVPRHKRRPRDVEWVRRQMERRGTIAYVESCVRDLSAAAISEAEYAFGSLPASDARDLLLSVTAYILDQSKSAARLRLEDEIR
jgi:geranylgeranyl diphosphate synthase type II